MFRFSFPKLLQFRKSNLPFGRWEAGSVQHPNQPFSPRRQVQDGAAKGAPHCSRANLLLLSNRSTAPAARPIGARLSRLRVPAHPPCSPTRTELPSLRVPQNKGRVAGHTGASEDMQVTQASRCSDLRVQVAPPAYVDPSWVTSPPPGPSALQLAQPSPAKTPREAPAAQPGGCNGSRNPIQPWGGWAAPPRWRNADANHKAACNRKPNLIFPDFGERSVWKTGPNPPAEVRPGSIPPMRWAVALEPAVMLHPFAELFTQEPNQFHLAGKEGRREQGEVPSPPPASSITCKGQVRAGSAPGRCSSAPWTAGASAAELPPCS